jgi:MoxR-like ATPase
MMPGDALGTNLFNFQTNTLPPTKGLVFTQILLADDQPHAQDPGRLLRP